MSYTINKKEDKVLKLYQNKCFQIIKKVLVDIWVVLEFSVVGTVHVNECTCSS